MKNSLTRCPQIMPVLGMMLLTVTPLLAYYAFRPFSVDGLRGGDNFQSVKRALPTQKFRQIERSTINDGVRPRYDHWVLETGGLNLNGVRGNAKFEFYNDQLMALVFSPIPFSHAQKVFGQGIITRNLRSRAVVHSDSKCVIWEDRKLQREMRQWVRNYS